LLVDSLSTASTACLARFLELDFQGFVANNFSIQTGNGGTGFVTFHFNKSKAFALAAEYVSRKFD